MQKTHIFFFSSLVLVSLCFSSISMADSQIPSSSEAKVHIIYTEKPQDQEPEDYHIKTLSSALGSEEAAKEALLYSYKHAASGFSARLTPEQAAEISKQPGVLRVVESRTLQLHLGPGKMHV